VHPSQNFNRLPGYGGISLQNKNTDDNDQHKNVLPAPILAQDE
jgi:hypothetical protein